MTNTANVFQIFINYILVIISISVEKGMKCTRTHLFILTYIHISKHDIGNICKVIVVFKLIVILLSSKYLLATMIWNQQKPRF
jgi:hypothetical protein